MKPKSSTGDPSSTVSLQRLVESRGIALRKEGSNFTGACPLHPRSRSKRNNLTVDPKSNTWACPLCKVKAGTVIDWIAKSEGVSPKHATELLKAGIISTTTKSVKTSTVPKLAAPFEPGADDQVVLQRVVDLYAESLADNATSKEFLKQRGLDDPNLIKEYRLGYSHRQLGYRLPAKNRAAGKALRGQLVRLGVMRPTGHEHLSGSLVVPVLDTQGQVVDLYGRKITPGLRQGTQQHLTLGPEPAGLFNIAGVEQSEDIILCKSILDGLSFVAAGITNVTATYGLGGITDQHRELLGKPGVRRVLIAFERSRKADKLATTLADDLVRQGKQVHRIVYPHQQDANDYHRGGRDLRELLRQAQWLGGVRTAAVGRGRASPSDNGSGGQGESQDQQDSLTFEFGPRTWRVRGHQDCTSLASIRVNLRVTTDTAFFSDTFDLLVARARQSFLRQARDELGVDEHVLKADLGRVILAVEEVADTSLRAKLDTTPTTYEMTEVEKEQAMALLKAPNLIDRILEGFTVCGVVGEENNKLLGYLVGLSRRLDEPLAVVIQSSSAAGKSSLMDAILRFVPEEEQVSYSAMTGQSLYYMAGGNLQHKLLSIAEDAGVSQAAYALRVLQSAGELTIASTGKDATTGRLSTHNYRVTGPVAIMLTTTSIEVDDELLSRCLVLTVDESHKQTEAIQALQRQARTLEGLVARQRRAEVEQLHQNAQRLLAPVHIVNPYAHELTFPSRGTRARRDQKKLLGLIDVIAYLHQHQRPHRVAEIGTGDVKYIEVTREDIHLASKLTAGMFNNNTDDLPPQTAKMLAAIREYAVVEAKQQGISTLELRFSRRQLREAHGWGEKQTRVHLDRLVELEHLVRHRGRQGQRYRYSLPDDSTNPTSSTAGPTSSTSEGRVSSNDAGPVGELRPLTKGTHQGKGGNSHRTRSEAR